MKNFFSLFVVVAYLFCATSCQDKTSLYNVQGTWSGSEPPAYIYIKEKVGDKVFVTIDSTKVENNKFAFSGKCEHIKPVLLFVENEKQDFLLEADSLVSVTVKADSTTRRNGEKVARYDINIVANSVNQKNYQWYQEVKLQKGMVGLTMLAAGLSLKSGSMTQDSAVILINMVQENYNHAADSFLLNTTNSCVATYFISDVMLKDNTFDEVKQRYNALSDEVKASYPGLQLKAKMDALQSVNVGGIAPEIELKAPDGNVVKLSSLKGKIVLLDFWASWCGPCRAEFPNVKEIYSMYKDKGFEIYAVSLDEDSAKWTSAIEKEELPWIHVSSLMGWKCPVAKEYNVTGIPKMFVLDKEGKIIATDLRGQALKDKMAELFN